MSVAMYPGATAFTVMRAAGHLLRQRFRQADQPAFDAA